MPLSRGRHYPPYQIAALTRLLNTEGIDAGAALAGTGLAPAELDDVACQTSAEQYLAVCRNALRLAPTAGLSLRLGRGLHLSDGGLYGLMLLTCESVGDYFRLASKYQALTGSALTLEAQVGDAGVRWLLDDEAVRELPPALRVFLVEQQFAQLVTQLQDLLGPECSPVLACFTHAATTTAQQAACAEHLQCPCVFGWHRNELRFGKDVLARRPHLANPLTSATLQAACDAQLADIEASLGIAGQVYRALRVLPGPGAGMQAVASTLKMTDRTLRRHLACEGTSFSMIADQVRYGMARQHLQGSQASVEQVAAMTGFSDPANFRRAFLRWTGMTPARFRRVQQERRAHAPSRAARSSSAASPIAALSL
jgi:AraC-like DNA-binding protein